MATQERTLDNDLVHLSAGLFDTIACTAPILESIDPRDSLSAIEVEVAPVGKPPRVRAAWTMAAIGLAAMVGTLASQVRHSPTAVQTPQVVRPGAPVAMVEGRAAMPAERRPATTEATVKAPIAATDGAAKKALRKVAPTPARAPLPAPKAASLPPGPPADFPPVPLAAPPLSASNGLVSTLR
jgi:hypothetical protein